MLSLNRIYAVVLFLIFAGVAVINADEKSFILCCIIVVVAYVAKRRWAIPLGALVSLLCIPLLLITDTASLMPLAYKMTFYLSILTLADGLLFYETPTPA